MNIEDFEIIDKIKFEGKDSTNPLAFKYYNPDEIIDGKPMREQLKFLLVHDPLTGIFNRRGFYDSIERFITENSHGITGADNKGKSLIVYSIDIDGLKQINDTYGHNEGDWTIKSIADAIALACGPLDVCGRIGGDEFVVIGRGEEFALIFEHRFEEELNRKNESEHKEYTLEASVGHITAIPDETDTLAEFIQQADAEMYKVKVTRKNHRQ